MMGYKSFVTVLLVLFCLTLAAQEDTISLKAKTTAFSVRNGEAFFPNAGSFPIQREVLPIPLGYSSKVKFFTFITDCDSIRVQYSPSLSTYFRVVVDGKDSVLFHLFSPDYLGKLRDGASFDAAQPVDLPCFSAASSSKNLAALRSAYNIDSIAGSGSELSRIANVLHWVHGVVKYDGQHDEPEGLSTLEMVELCKREGRGLHCGALAWVLADCLQSIGVKARQVVCLPKDTLDTECHSIVAVYSDSLRKWLWADPTNDAYVMDDRGVALSIDEVRDRLIRGLPLVLNADASFGGEPLDAEQYLYNYMAKNLYRFRIFAVDVDADGAAVSYTMELVPNGYYPHLPMISKEKNGRSANIKVVTSNAAAFWKVPFTVAS